MANSNRPPNPRLSSINPIYDPELTEIPVTPGHDDTGRTSFFQNSRMISSPDAESPEGIGSMKALFRRISD